MSGYLRSSVDLLLDEQSSRKLGEPQSRSRHCDQKKDLVASLGNQTKILALNSPYHRYYNDSVNPALKTVDDMKN